MSPDKGEISRRFPWGSTLPPRVCVHKMTYDDIKISEWGGFAIAWIAALTPAASETTNDKYRDTVSTITQTGVLGRLQFGRWPA